MQVANCTCTYADPGRGAVPCWPPSAAHHPPTVQTRSSPRSLAQRNRQRDSVPAGDGVYVEAWESGCRCVQTARIIIIIVIRCRAGAKRSRAGQPPPAAMSLGQAMARRAVLRSQVGTYLQTCSPMLAVDPKHGLTGTHDALAKPLAVSICSGQNRRAVQKLRR